ncbi:MAG TPA: serine O-acetyltransferase [Kofleriaceae bacterium]|jgi:serine O-acetyltransferase|nr:serine O-acetyltransferase [Kofleriaceae bacterium]
MSSRAGTVTDDVASQLLASYRSCHSGMQHLGGYELPSEEQIARIVEQCRALLFPGFAGSSASRLTPTELRDLVRERLDELRNSLRREVYRAFNHRNQVANRDQDLDCPDCATQAEQVVARFLTRLPALRELVASDVQAAYEGDPAATGADEIIVCYPGVYATTVYRIANALLHEGAVIVPRMMTELAHQRTGIDIHPGAAIGRSFFIDHGTGVVIGETTTIGERVRLYQGVTLGAMSVPRTEERPRPGARRHPTIEDDVVIYAGATILGGDTVIGKGAVIGGNAWVTASVSPGARVAGSVSRRDA